MAEQSAGADSTLLLAGGGHSHALVLRMWAMEPRRRPAGLITLVNRCSTALYSGMVPGLIAGRYRLEEVAIDLRPLADRAGVALVIAEISGLDPSSRQLQLEGRPPLAYDRLSLDVGAVSPLATGSTRGDTSRNALIPIKPLEPALALLAREDQRLQQEGMAAGPFQIIGAGLAGVEVALALRQRWPQRRLLLRAHPGQPQASFRRALAEAGIERLESSDPPGPATAPLAGLPGLACTGSRAPAWLADSGLPCCPSSGRVLTDATLQVIDHPGHWASGDCAVIAQHQRAPAGVWAVRAAAPLAANLKAASRGRHRRPWRPQRRAMQLLGSGRASAWLLWGPLILGPHPWLWRWKEAIDRRFMQRFCALPPMGNPQTMEGGMRCRGCAAKLAAAPLEAALQSAGLEPLGSTPEDANPLPGVADRRGQPVLQSVDGFPALVSDPWLNGRITTLHACSDLWACGARLSAAQAVVTVPEASANVQQHLLSQTLAGIRSALEEQGAPLIGGHSLEARDATSSDPLSLGVQVLLSVTGSAAQGGWPKRGLQAGDQLLLSRPLGTGVLFAAAMAGAARPQELDDALARMATSQHPLLEALQALEEQHPGQIHAATDITGFGLLGHLGEMLGPASPARAPAQVTLEAEAIPALAGALRLLEAGHTSSLAPANRRAWALLDPGPSSPARVRLHLGRIDAGSAQHQALLELLVDPQTCGPLLLAVTPALAEQLLRAPANEAAAARWQRIGTATDA